MAFSASRFPADKGAAQCNPSAQELQPGRTAPSRRGAMPVSDKQPRKFDDANPSFSAVRPDRSGDPQTSPARTQLASQREQAH